MAHAYSCPLWYTLVHRMAIIDLGLSENLSVIYQFKHSLYQRRHHFMLLTSCGCIGFSNRPVLNWNRVNWRDGGVRPRGVPRKAYHLILRELQSRPQLLGANCSCLIWVQRTIARLYEHEVEVSILPCTARFSTAIPFMPSSCGSRRRIRSRRCGSSFKSCAQRRIDSRQPVFAVAAWRLECGAGPQSS